MKIYISKLMGYSQSSTFREIYILTYSRLKIYELIMQLKKSERTEFKVIK